MCGCRTCCGAQVRAAGIYAARAAKLDYLSVYLNMSDAASPASRARSLGSIHAWQQLVALHFCARHRIA